MCIALPMKVLESGPMMVVCERNGRRLEVDCSMIDQPAVGAWLLVFQNRALREIEEAEAGEIEAALGATARVMAGDVDDETIRSGFGGYEFGLADAVLAADAEDGLFALHLVCLAAARLYGGGHSAGSGYGLAGGRGGLRVGLGDAYYLSDAEVVAAQSGVGVADGFGRYVVLHGQPVKGFAGGYGVEGFLFGIGGVAWYAQCLSDVYFLVAARVELDDVGLAHSVHAGNGVQALSFFDGVQEV